MPTKTTKKATKAIVENAEVATTTTNATNANEALDNISNYPSTRNAEPTIANDKYNIYDSNGNIDFSKVVFREVKPKRRKNVFIIRPGQTESWLKR